ncbi:MAG: glycoside hydrolase family 18 protein [Polyangiaceae bacterium]|nr:glycoside hydrolase family 18 protein [Polyangiaceae bacterium]
MTAELVVVKGKDRGAFVALAKDLRAAWPAAILTAPAGWVTLNTPAVDPTWPELAKVVDQINLMSYGMAGPWGGWQSWHSSALIGESASMPSSVDVSVKNYLKAGVPAAKLGVGIGFYGSCWRGVSAVRMPITGASLVADDGKMSFANIMTSYYQAAAYHYDAAAKAPWLGFSTQTGPEKCNLVTYEDATSLADKGKYVRDTGLGGAIIWTINQGHLASAPAGSRDPLLAAVKKAFLD